MTFVAVASATAAQATPKRNGEERAVVKVVEAPPGDPMPPASARQEADHFGSVSVRTLTARSPGRRDGGAFGNPIGPASRPPPRRQAVRLPRRTTTGFQRLARCFRPPRRATA